MKAGLASLFLVYYFSQGLSFLNPDSKLGRLLGFLFFSSSEFYLLKAIESFSHFLPFSHSFWDGKMPLKKSSSNPGSFGISSPISCSYVLMLLLMFLCLDISLINFNRWFKKYKFCLAFPLIVNERKDTNHLVYIQRSSTPPKPNLLPCNPKLVSM